VPGVVRGGGNLQTWNVMASKQPAKISIEPVLVLSSLS